MSKYTGSIKISKVSDVLIKLNAANYNQVVTVNSVVIENIDYPSQVLKDLSKFADECKEISTTKHKDYYEVSDFDKAVDEISNFIHGNIKDLTFIFNQQEYDILIHRYLETPTVQIKGKIFELQMSRKYNAFVFSDVPSTFISKFGLNKVDTGIDLVDTKNKILYQCKYSESNLSMNEQLKRTLAMYDKIKQIDDSYTLKLLVNKEMKVSKTVSEKFDIIKEMFNEEDIPKHTPIEICNGKQVIYGKGCLCGKHVIRTTFVVDEAARKQIDYVIYELNRNNGKSLNEEFIDVINRYSESSYFKNKLRTNEHAKLVIEQLLKRT